MRRPTALAAATAIALALLLLVAAAAGGRRAAAVPAEDEPPPPPPPSPDADAEDDARLFARMADLVEARGYPLEMAPVHSTDGHRSLVFRIPHGKKKDDGDDDGGANKQKENKRPAVLLQHGLLGSCADWVLNDGPGESLAFTLADAGFDVFLANARGNEYGRGGVAGGGPASSFFWAWSWDEMAAFDLPAAVDHALATSSSASATTSRQQQQKSLFLVAFSQGTTTALASLASGRLDANKIAKAVLLGPVAYATHVKSVPLRRLAALGTDQVLMLLGAREFSPSSELLRRLGGDACVTAPWLCVSVLTALCGYSPDNSDPSRIPFYLNYTPSGTSVQNIAHWSQAVRGGRGGGGGGGDDDDGGDGRGTRAGGGPDGDGGGGGRGGPGPSSSPRMLAFDYGKPANQRIYGQAEPPEYDLRRGLTRAPPLFLITGGKDRLADPRDAALLSSALKDAGVLAGLHHEPEFEHLDFVWGVKALPRVHRVVVEELMLGLRAAAGAREGAAAERGGEGQGGGGGGGVGLVGGKENEGLARAVAAS